MIRHVLLKRFCELTGYTVDAVRIKMDRGVFIRGVHYDVEGDRNIKIDLEAYSLWAQGVPAGVILEWKQEEIRSVYASTGAVGAPKRSNSRPVPQT